MSTGWQPRAVFGEEGMLALSLAKMSLLRHPGETERAARMLQSVLGWSFERALWFIQVNGDYLPGDA
jgi:hypothetical protein